MTAIPRYTVLEKPVGKTPLQAIGEWKTAHPELAHLPASYAGRLDPMASGKLLVLLGEECKKQKAYTGLDKEYEIEVVLGIGTDTGDALGLAEISEAEAKTGTRALRTALERLRGTHMLPYPVFSSKTVAGKPLFLYALEGRLGEIEIPAHKETIYGIELLGEATVSAAVLRERIGNILSRTPRSQEPSKALGADFRIDAVRASWEALFRTAGAETFSIVRLRVTCASGTYMRTLGGRLGTELDTKGFALSIHRTKIGRCLRLGPWGLWTKLYS